MNYQNYRTCQISSPYFWGFKYRIDLDTVETPEDITSQILTELKKVLTDNNLVVLLEMIEGKQGNKKMHFHVHTHDNIEKILLSKPDEIIYVCSHEH